MIDKVLSKISHLLTFSIVGDKFGISITICSGSENCLLSTWPKTCMGLRVVAANLKPIELTCMKGVNAGLAVIDRQKDCLPRASFE